jgi:hypothetical protein
MAVKVLVAVCTAIVTGIVLGGGVPAQATVGSQPGKLELSPASGAKGTTPTWATTIGCPGGFQGSASLEAIATDGTPFDVALLVNGAQVANSFSGTLAYPMGAIQSLGGFDDGSTTGQEFVVLCWTGSNGSGISTAYQDSFAYYSADNSYLTSATASLASQAITFTSTAPSGATVGGPTYNVTATGGASGNLRGCRELRRRRQPGRQRELRGSAPGSAVVRCR